MAAGIAPHVCRGYQMDSVVMIDLYGYSLLTIFLVGLAAIFAVSELGWRPRNPE